MMIQSRKCVLQLGQYGVTFKIKDKDILNIHAIPTTYSVALISIKLNLGKGQSVLYGMAIYLRSF